MSYYDDDVAYDDFQEEYNDDYEYNDYGYDDYGSVAVKSAAKKKPKAKQANQKQQPAKQNQSSTQQVMATPSLGVASSATTAGTTYSTDQASQQQFLAPSAPSTHSSALSTLPPSLMPSAISSAPTATDVAGDSYNPTTMYTEESVAAHNTLLASQWNATGHCDLLPIHSIIFSVVKSDYSECHLELGTFHQALARHLPNSRTLTHHTMQATVAAAATDADADTGAAANSRQHENSLVPTVPNAVLDKALSTFPQCALPPHRGDLFDERPASLFHRAPPAAFHIQNHRNPCSVDWCMTAQRLVYLWSTEGGMDWEQMLNVMSLIGPTVAIFHISAAVGFTAVGGQAAATAAAADAASPSTDDSALSSSSSLPYMINPKTTLVMKQAHVANRLGVRQALIIIDDIDDVQYGQETYIATCTAVKQMLSAVGFVTSRDASLVHFVPCNSTFDWNITPQQSQQLITAAHTHANTYNMHDAVPLPGEILPVPTSTPTTADVTPVNFNPPSWYHGASVVELLDKLHLSTTQLESVAKISPTYHHPHTIADNDDDTAVVNGGGDDDHDNDEKKSKKSKKSKKEHKEHKQKSAPQPSSSSFEHEQPAPSSSSHHGIVAQRIIPTIPPHALEYACVPFERQQDDITHIFCLKTIFIDVRVDGDIFISGVISNGACCVGQRVVLFPLYQPCEITDMLVCGRPVQGAFAGDIVLLRVRAMAQSNPLIPTRHSIPWGDYTPRVANEFIGQQFLLLGPHIPRVARKLTVQIVSSHTDFRKCSLHIPSVGYYRKTSPAIAVPIEHLAIPTVATFDPPRDIVVKSTTAVTKSTTPHLGGRYIVSLLIQDGGVPLFLLPRFQHVVSTIQEQFPNDNSTLQVEKYVQYDMPNAPTSWYDPKGISNSQTVVPEIKRDMLLGQYIPIEHAAFYDDHSIREDPRCLAFQGVVMTAAIIGYEE